MSLSRNFDPTTIEPAEAPESEFNIAEYLGMVRRHSLLVAAITATALIAGLIHYFITPKEYRASAMLQIERRSNVPVLEEQNIWDNYWNVEFYPTQYELLRSRGLAERVAKNLDLANDPAWNPSAAQKNANAPNTSVADDEASLGAMAEGLRGGLAIDPIRTTSLVVLSYRSRDPEFAARAANGFAEAYIDLGIEDRYTSAGKASSFLGTQIETLKKEITDKESQLQQFSRRSDIVAIDPSSNVLLQRLEVANSDFMNAKRNRIEKQSRYQEILSSPKEAIADSLSGGVISDLRSEQLKRERDYETKLKTFKPDWPGMVTLKAEIEKGQQHLNGVIEETVRNARNAAYGEYQTALRQEQALGGEVSSMKGEAIDQSSAAVEFSNLKVEIDTRRELLDQLMKRQSETEVSARLQGTRESNIRIIDRALVPGGPFRPSLRQDLTYGLLVGLLLGVALAFLIEFLDRTIKSPEEIERRLKLPTLAVIPDIAETGRVYGYGRTYGTYGNDSSDAKDSKSAVDRGRSAAKSGAAWLDRKKKVAPEGEQIELVPHERPRTPISEVYRSLRTALLLSSAEELKVIAVTSASAGEGKTATASNLAVVLAQLGRSVLIVDSDLRKPRMHQVFRTSNRVGLVNQLTGTADPEAVFLRTQVPNLWLTPSGPIPPNPSELLASERMRDWIQMVRKRFDYIVIDTPPALAVTDATIAGALADGMLLTFRAGKITRDDARDCADRLRMADLKILGVVLNRHRTNVGRYGKSYRYYESYGAYETESAKAGSAA